MTGRQPLFSPVTRKRLARFRRHRRAYTSLRVLAGLFLLSLCSELVCNDRPLFLRYEGRTFFPVFLFYHEDTFLDNGRTTRTDYHALLRSDRFAANPGNRMVFPPVAYGPHTTIDADSLRGEERVVLRLDPVSRVGNVNVREDWTVARSTTCGFFFGSDDGDVRQKRLTDHWDPGPDLRAGVLRRFRNLESPSETVISRGKQDPDLQVELSLSAYSPRARLPRSVRVTLREPLPEGAGSRRIVFDRRQAPVDRTAGAWKALDPGTRAQLTNHVHRAFDETVIVPPMEISGVLHRVQLEKNDVSWPHRPVRGHWMGIDSAGRDVFARVLYALRISLLFGLLLVAVAMVVGFLVGAVQGYYVGWVDITGQRLIEIWSTMPFLYIMILLGSIYGPSFGLLLFIYGIFNWIGISYYVRAEFLRLRKQPFVDSARCMGTPTALIMFRHIMPNALTPVITFFPFSLVGAIGSLAALDYLGFGLPPPTPSWGQLLHQAQSFRWAWWLILYPSLALFVVMLLGVFIGEGVRDAYDPKPFSRME